MRDIIDKINDLMEKLNKWNYEYYHLNGSSVSDSVYDAGIEELKSLERKYPQYSFKNSPTKKVGGFVSDEFLKYTHKYPMLSLNNAFSVLDLENFIKQIKIEGFDNEYIVEPKIDGLSMSLIYKNGKLEIATTRGDGVKGENVTNNILMIEDIPKIIDSKEEYLEVRGEVFFTKEQFEKINNERKNKDEQVFANARNAASGTIRQLNSLIVKDRNLNFFAYEILGKDFSKQTDKIDFLSKNNFSTSEMIKKCVGLNQIEKQINLIQSKRDKINYDIDGVVIKLNGNAYHQIMGNTSKFPKWAIAYKLPSEVVETKLEDIFMTVGRTGRINYNARLLPIKLAGTTVKNATLHNADYIEKLDIRIGDYVNVKKAGDIIPKVLSVNLSKRNNNKKWKKETSCKFCNSSLVEYDGEVDQFCVNDKCDKKIIESLIYFCSKNSMNIENLGGKIIETFYKNKIVNSIQDIYYLEKKKDIILELEGFKDKSFQNIVDSVNKSKSNSLEFLITGLGIKHIGSRAAKLISEKIKSLDSTSSFSEIRGVGEKISESWNKWISQSKNKELIEELKKLGLNLNYLETEVKSKTFKEMNFVITGTLSKPRQYFVNTIVDNSGSVQAAISSNTTYLLAGENSGSKLQKAKKLNIKILTESQFNNLISN